MFRIPIYPNSNHGYIGNVCAHKAKNIKIKPCEICGKTDGIEKHHEDYNNPLNVRFLCKTHHRDIHKIIRKIKKRGKLELFK